jgi:methionine aminopeptidase
MEMAIRMLKPSKGFKNVDITENIMKVAKIYETTPVENMLSHQVERFKTACDKQIIQNPIGKQSRYYFSPTIEKCTFEDYEVYAIDILISSGEGNFLNCELSIKCIMQENLNRAMFDQPYSKKPMTLSTI